MKDYETVSLAQAKSGLFFGADLSVYGVFVKSFRRGDLISEIQNGEACVGILASGRADVFSVSYNLEKSNISTLVAGSEFGICNIFVHNPMPTEIIAKVACSVVYLPKSDFVLLLESNTEVMKRYLALCNNKMLFLAEKIELMGISSASAKLAYYIMRNIGETDFFEMTMPKEQLAKYLNVSRASLFRAFAELASEKIIECSGSVVRVLDKARLREFR